MENKLNHVKFYKMHGAGNDFILVDDRTRTFPCNDRQRLLSLADRKRGIGSDGIILIQPSAQADFTMRFFNPDGGEAEMCGNGARCVARLAHDLGVAGQNMTFETVAGQLSADICGDNVRLYMTPPHSWRMNIELEIDGQRISCHQVNTGVPHAVIETDAIDSLDLPTIGAAIRYHETFAPAGTNANFIQKTGTNVLRIRTYERGVEAETLACGTGMVAAALIAARRKTVTAPVTLQTAGNDQLEVDFKMDEEGTATEVTLTGPAVHVFNGTVTL